MGSDRCRETRSGRLSGRAMSLRSRLQIPGLRFQLPLAMRARPTDLLQNRGWKESPQQYSELTSSRTILAQLRQEVSAERLK
jgi:hypothetical protein